MNKNIIRKVARDLRLNRTLKDTMNMNKMIKKTLFSYFDLSKYENILIYLSSAEKGEVDTWNIIKDLRYKNLFVPYVDKTTTNGMYMTKYTDTFVRNDFGILECVDNKIEKDVAIHLAILPMLAFDKGGNRIGYGKGYFDTFLAQFKGATLVGLCAEGPYDNFITEPHDVPMDYVVTPEEVYKF